MTLRRGSLQTHDIPSHPLNGFESHEVAPQITSYPSHCAQATSSSSSQSLASSRRGSHDFVRHSNPQVIPHPSSYSHTVSHASIAASPSTASPTDSSFAISLQDLPTQNFSSRAPDLLEVLRTKSQQGILQIGERLSACERCRKRKIKCDRRQPICGTCIRLGTECSNQDALQRRGPPTLHQEKRLSKLAPTPGSDSRHVGPPTALPIGALPNDAYVPRPTSISEPDVPIRWPRPAHSKRPAHGVVGPAGSKIRRPPTILEEALPLPPMPSSASPPTTEEIPIPESILAAEVSTGATVTVQLMERHQFLMPPLGGFDQITAAYLSRMARGKELSTAPGKLKVTSINRLAQVQLVDFDTFPRTMDAMCILYPQEKRGRYLASAGIDVNDVGSVRAGACKLLAHPAALHLHNWVKLFHSRAPTFWSPDVEATIHALAKNQIPRVSVAWLGMCLAFGAIGTANSPPLRLNNTDDGPQPELAVLIEFGLTCYYLSSEIADRSLELYDVGDPSAGLAQLQVSSWLSTTSLFSEDPQKWHCYWSSKAWLICKHYGFHKVNRRRSSLLHQHQMSPAAAKNFPTPAQFKVELTMRAVWGLVIVAAMQLIASNTNQSFLDEEVECDYPSSLIRDGTPAAEHPIPHVSDECFEAWSQFVHIQHLYVRMMTTRLGQKSFWTDVSEVEIQLASSRDGSYSSAATTDPAKRWLSAVAAVLEARLVILDQFCAEFEGIAGDAHAYKAHNAQPRLPTGGTDLSGWLFVKNQALRTLSSARRRLHDWESELSDGMRLLDAMESPLPPSLSGTASLTPGEEEEEWLEYGASHIDDGASSDVTMSGASLGAMTMPETMRRSGYDTTGNYQYAAAGSTGLDTAPSQPAVSKLRARLSRRSALEARVGDWLADVPDAPPTSEISSQGEKDFKAFVAGDVL